MKKIVISLIVVILLVLSYIFFFDEYFDYLEVINSKNLNLIENYYKEHPNGFFTESVKFHELSITDDIEKSRNFINQYRNSKYIDEVKNKYDAIWFREIERYIKHIKSTPGADPKAVKFFTSLLYYLRDNYTKKVHLNLIGDVVLKEFKNYDKESQNALINDIKKTPGSPPLGPNLLPLTNVYSMGHIKSLEEIVKQALKKSFEKVLSENFIEVITDDTSKSADLRIDIFYKIKNEESSIENIKTPALWEYWRYNKFVAYLMGIAIDFKFKFTIPGTKEVYYFETESFPGDFVREIGDVKNGYVMMTKMSFDRFAQDIINKFGLKKPNQFYF
ncbi:hypothetical protein D9V86_11055 [Bacteroidetes/Chlorobi group bacterium ChocPot_Mid]|nr:MAG: hypothetical protein D9V86_11055 [Bacteroidetes/Chlorobi group bacterium ChocPot_Mid]